MDLPFYPAGLHDLARVFTPESAGGRLPKAGLLDIAASCEPDGRSVYNNINYGMFVTFKAPNEYSRDCFKQYGLLTDKSGLVWLNVAAVSSDWSGNKYQRNVCCPAA